MKTIFEVSTTDYEKNKELLIKALNELQSLFQLDNDYELSEPMARFGWTFFKLWIRPTLLSKIDEKFSEMIKNSKGSKSQEKFTNFISDFFESRGCKVKLKQVED